MNQPQQNRQQAFTMVELLVAILVIAFVTSLAIPVISSVREAAEESRDRRNAQHIASIFNASVPTGIEFLEPGDLAATIANVVEGQTVEDPKSPFFGLEFSLPGLSVQEQQSAARFLSIVGDRLIYRTDPDTSLLLYEEDWELVELTPDEETAVEMAAELEKANPSQEYRARPDLSGLFAVVRRARR